MRESVKRKASVLKKENLENPPKATVFVDLLDDDVDDEDIKPNVDHQPTVLNFDNLYNPNIVRTKRDVPASHYTLEIDSFSGLQRMLTRTGDTKIESRVFQAGGFTWKILFYPNGNMKENGKGNISVSLKLMSSTAHLSTELNVMFSVIIHDHLRSDYLMVQDGTVKKYSYLQKEWGMSKVLPLKAFTDACNGFLVDDSCQIGVEVSVLNNGTEVVEERLLTFKQESSFAWTASGIFRSNNEVIKSPCFSVGGYNWKLVLYPSGTQEETGRSLSLFLSIDDPTKKSTTNWNNNTLYNNNIGYNTNWNNTLYNKIGYNTNWNNTLYNKIGYITNHAYNYADDEDNNTVAWKIYAEFTLCIRNLSGSGKNHIKSCSHLFCLSEQTSGRKDFISLSELRNKGFISNGDVILEAQITHMSTLNKMS